ncbi:MAG: CBS domain-containing protein [Gammaproteobacteria bacterium]|nr:CBS domain-containing protein [Gammaproteobacteria bacterium]
MDITVRDYMATQLVTFSPDMEIMAAMRTLIDKNISGACVLDATGNIVGILSEKDCMRVALGASYHGDKAGLVKEYMSPQVETVDVDTGIIEIATLFYNKQYRRYPVLDQGKLVGQISRRDVLKALNKF